VEGNLAAELNTNRIYEIPSRQKRSFKYRIGIGILQLVGRGVATNIISTNDEGNEESR